MSEFARGQIVALKEGGVRNAIVIACVMRGGVEMYTVQPQPGVRTEVRRGDELVRATDENGQALPDEKPWPAAIRVRRRP